MELRPVTNANFAFTANMTRAWAFLHIFDKPGGAKQRTRGRPTDNEKELLRAAVVFGVAALDAYLHDLVLEEVSKGNGNSSALTEAFRTIAKEDPAIVLRVALADSKAARRTEFRAALDSWLSAKSFHGPEAVVRALTYVGHPMSAQALTLGLGADWASRLTHWTEMRHGLVHRGTKPYVRRADSGNCLELVGRIVEVVDEVVAGPPINL